MEFKNRKPLRLSEFDYGTPGAYFITICTHNRQKTLSQIVGAIHESPNSAEPLVGAIHESPKSILTAKGKIVDAVIKSLPQHIGVAVDRYVIMPNHVHLMLMIEEDPRAIHESPLRNRSPVSNAVGYIKMNASKMIHKHFGDEAVWQRGYYDHIIRNERDYLEIAKYLAENPIRWQLDCYYEL